MYILHLALANKLTTIQISDNNRSVPHEVLWSWSQICQSLHPPDSGAPAAGYDAIQVSLNAAVQYSNPQSNSILQNCSITTTISTAAWKQHDHTWDINTTISRSFYSDPIDLPSLGLTPNSILKRSYWRRPSQSFGYYWENQVREKLINKPRLTCH